MKEHLDDLIACSASGSGFEHGARSRRECRVLLAAGCHKVRQKGDPVAVALVHSIPQRPESCTT